MPVPRFLELRLALPALLGATLVLAASPALEAAPAPQDPWAPFVEPGFPMFSSVLDARSVGSYSISNNLTPRGLVLQLKEGVWVCFDLDLLRVSAVWTGGAVSPSSMAQSSYQHWDVKSGYGEKPGSLPVPEGRVWMANGIYPGWQVGSAPSQTDPRAPGPDPEEVGRGALPPELGKFDAVLLTRFGARLEYSVGGVGVRERMSVLREQGRPVLVRWLEVAPSRRPLVLALSRQSSQPHGPDAVAAAVGESDGGQVASLTEKDGLLYLTVAPHADTVNFRVGLASGGIRPDVGGLALPADVNDPPAPLWPQTVVTRGKLAAPRSAYVVDEIGLPLNNPWRRNVRPGDIQFMPDGSAAAITLDGDVWRITGLGGDLSKVSWKRFASGFNESLSLAIRHGEIFVFDRGGIWRLKDTTGRGEADRYELFCNVFAQSSDTREFPSAIKVAPDGSFVIAKGGEAETRLGKHNGTVIRVSPDGRKIEVLGWGFRQPFIGVNPETGMVTSSDQEGHYVPATPLYIVSGDKFHGFLSPFQPKEQYPAPIAEPLTWIPHTVSPSGITQVWLTGSKMGPLSGTLVMLSYSFPELFRVMQNHRESRPQAAVVSITRDFLFPPLSAGVDPVDGQLYVAGFKIFGTASERIAGVARVRYTGLASVLPKEVVPMDSGVLLRFDVPLSPITAENPANYTVERWNYKRTWLYGSPHYRLDGSVGQDGMGVGGAYLSKDGKSVFLAVADMKTGVMQMHVGWSISARDGEEVKNDSYFTPYVLSHFQAEQEGFGDLAVPAKAVAAPVQAVGGVAEGGRLAQAFGCVACHSPDGSLRVGPTWKGLYGQTVTFADGSTQTADGTYIREHLGKHPNRMVRGYVPEMPDYTGIVDEGQIRDIIAYIKSLAAK